MFLLLLQPLRLLPLLLLLGELQREEAPVGACPGGWVGAWPASARVSEAPPRDWAATLRTQSTSGYVLAIETPVPSGDPASVPTLVGTRQGEVTCARTVYTEVTGAYVTQKT